jgi:hypothetical protein
MMAIMKYFEETNSSDNFLQNITFEAAAHKKITQKRAGCLSLPYHSIMERAYVFKCSLYA